MNGYDLIFWIAVTGMVTLAVIAVVQWIIAERDERRWQRKLQEQRTAALIREARYGQMKKGRGL